MRKSILLSAIIATVTAATPVAMPTAAYAADQVYHGTSHRYRYRCHRSKGTTGLLVGAGGGGLAAAALGAGPIGLAAGVVGGGLLGRHIDKRQNAANNRRRGC